jgi:hypothetical protein
MAGNQAYCSDHFKTKLALSRVRAILNRSLQNLWAARNRSPPPNNTPRHKAHQTKNPTMPLTLTLTEDVLPTNSLNTAIERLTDSMLKWHQLTGNTVMTPNVTANIHIVQKGHSYSGGVPFQGAWVEWKVPSFAFASSEIQKAFGQDAVDIISELSGGKQPKHNIYFNVVHTVDGTWNLNGQAMSNEELGAVIATGAPVAEAK